MGGDKTTKRKGNEKQNQNNKSRKKSEKLQVKENYAAYGTSKRNRVRDVKIEMVVIWSSK